MKSTVTPLEIRDYERILRVVEDCGRTRSFEAFREEVLEALARHLGYRHTTLFVAQSLHMASSDAAPVVRGRGRRMLAPYLDRFHALDPFARLAQRCPSAFAAPLSLDSLSGSAGPEFRDYVEAFLLPHGIHGKIAIPLLGPAMAARIGLLAAESSAFGARDLARARALAPHLANLFSLHAGAGKPRALCGLTARQTEIAQMAANGATNQQIALALFISLDTVKKHLTGIYESVGCVNRTELSVAWHSDCSWRPTPGLMTSARRCGPCPRTTPTESPGWRPATCCPAGSAGLPRLP